MFEEHVNVGKRSETNHASHKDQADPIKYGFWTPKHDVLLV